MTLVRQTLLLTIVFFTVCGAAHAQDDQPASPAAARKADGVPAPLVVLFDSGSTSLRAHEKNVLDRAARAYNEGKPIVMILSGSADRVGNAKVNLKLSQQRANAVLNGLVERGIPVERFQVLAKGETEPAVPNKPGVSEEQNRRVEISWH